MPALSLFNITFMLSQALGFILFAPILLSFLPTFHIARLVFDPLVQLYGIIALFYLVCALLIVLIPKASFREGKQQRNKTGTLTETMSILNNVWTEMYQGWSFVRRNKALFLAIIQLSFAGILMLVISQLATPIVTQLLGLPATSMAFIFAPAGIGLVAGSVLMPHITRRTGKARAILIGVIMLTVATTLLPLVTMLAHVLEPRGWNGNPLLLIGVALIMAAAGFALDFINIPALTAVQELTPEWIKGRVLALQLMLYNACAIPIILFIGVFADLFGLNLVLYLMTVCEIAFGAWGVYYNRKHKQRMAASEETEDEQKELQEIAP